MSRVGISSCAGYGNDGNSVGRGNNNTGRSARHIGNEVLKREIAKHFNFHGGLDNFARSGERALLKPNLLAAPIRAGEPVTTDAAIIVAMAELLREHGVHVVVGDSPAFSTARNILKKIGAEKALGELGVEIAEFNRPVERLSSLTVDRAVLECDKIINLPKIKVHCQMQYTLGLKNLFGCITGKRKPLLHMLHGDNEERFAELFIRLYEQVRPAFTLADGIVAMEGKGPRKGRRADFGLLFSGVDCVALDRVIIEVLGRRFEEYPLLKAAKELNIGQWRLKEIEIVGLKKMPQRELELPPMIPISFSPFRVAKSTIKNLVLKGMTKIR